MEVRYRQELGLPVGEPLGPRPSLALRAVAVAAGVVGDPDQTAVLTLLGMAPERCAPAGLDRRHDPAFNPAEVSGMGLTVGVAVTAEDIRHLWSG